MNAGEKISAARIQALSRWPYAASVLFAFRLVEVPKGLDTLAVDAGLRLYYNPKFVSTLDVHALATALLHEVLHVVHNHSERFKLLEDARPDASIFNIAGDLGINDILLKSGMTFGDSFTPMTFGAFDSKLGLDPNKPTEDAYYKLLPEDENAEEAGAGVPSPEGEKSKDGDPSPVDKDAPDEGAQPDSEDSGGGLPGAEDDDVEPESKSQNGGSFSTSGKSDCGSIAGGQAREYELGANDETAPAAGREIIDMVLDDFATQATNHAKVHGDLPGGLAKVIDNYLNPKINWRRQLGALVRKEVASISGRRDYSFRRPSRRQDAMRGGRTEVILPSMRQQPPPDIAVIFDTSGSMSDEDLVTAVSEIFGIAQTLSGRAKLTAIPCDSQVSEIFNIRTLAEMRKVRAIGRGGTDMRVGIAFAASLKPKPQVIVVITDGETPWPEEKPRGVAMVLALLTQKKMSSSVPEWMESVSLDL